MRIAEHLAQLGLGIRAVRPEGVEEGDPDAWNLPELHDDHVQEEPAGERPGDVAEDDPDPVAGPDPFRERRGRDRTMQRLEDALFRAGDRAREAGLDDGDAPVVGKLKRQPALSIRQSDVYKPILLN